jgi:hypothetical protein
MNKVISEKGTRTSEPTRIDLIPKTTNPKIRIQVINTPPYSYPLNLYSLRSSSNGSQVFSSKYLVTFMYRNNSSGVLVCSEAVSQAGIF